MRKFVINIFKVLQNARLMIPNFLSKKCLKASILRSSGYKLVVITIFSMSLSACLSSYNLTEGITSFKQQNYRQAFIRLLPEAKKGNPDAQYAVGYMYYYGQGVIEDRKKALEWIRHAALAKQPDAIVALRALRHEPKIK